MKQFYVPYVGKRPAALSINGHRLLILSKEREPIEQGLDLLGGDRVKLVNGGSTKIEETKLIERLSRAAGAGVVIAPNNTEIPELLRSLENELPWLQ